MELLEDFLSEIKNKFLFQKNDTLIVAVSGGADSVALCELCHLAGYNFEMAHCNFELRGDESDRDENFVKELALKYGVPFHLKKFDTEKFSTENNISIQVAARELRYDWFRELLDAKGQNSYLLTAHHANDNIETLLMNFFKGSGIRGLQGIPQKYGRVRRPLLFASKAQILDFLKKQNLSFVEDSSNLSDKYTRNFFRNKLLPEIETVFPRVESNLVKNLERFGEIGELYHQAIATHKKKLLEFKGNEVEIPVLKLLKTKPLGAVLYEIIRDYHFTPAQTHEVANLLNSPTGKSVHSATHKIFKNRNRLVISSIKNKDASHILIEETDQEIAFDDRMVIIKKLNWNTGDSISVDPTVALADASRVTFPLLLRKWKQGDYFYPLGMNKKKKLSRFLIDQKLSMSEKENLWVLENNKKIIWIVGMRIDDRFKVTSQTKEVLKMKIQIV